MKINSGNKLKEIDTKNHKLNGYIKDDNGSKHLWMKIKMKLKYI